MTKQKKRPNKKKPVSKKKANSTAGAVTPTWDWRDPAWFLMAVIIAIPMLGPTAQLQGLPWVIRLSFLLPVLPLLLAYTAYRKSSLSLNLQPAMLALWGVVLMAVMTAFWAVNGYGAIAGIIKWFYVVLMSIAVYTLARDVGTHRKIIIACALAGGYMAMIGVTQYLLGHELYITPIGQYPWPSATSGHKNMASQFVVMTLPFALYLSITARNSIGYWLANPLVALMLAYIVYGRARQVFIALFVLSLIMLIAAVFARSRRLIKPRSLSKDYFFSVIASVVLFVALVMAPPFDKPFDWEKSAVSEFTSRTEVFTKEGATLEEMSSGRVATWLKTSNMIRNHPAGVGLNNWTVHYPRYNAEAGKFYRPRGHDVWGDAHNDYLQMLAELGLVALLLAGLMLFGLWKLYRRIWTEGDEESQRHSLFVGMGLMALFTVMFFSFPLTRTATPMFLGIYLALLTAMAALPAKSKAEKRLKFGPMLVVPLLLLAVAGGYVGQREAAGWHHTFVAKALGERIFQPGENNPFATRRMMLLLGEHTDKGISLEPYAPILLRDHIASYTNLSLKIDHERLAGEYRRKALETAERYLATFPYDSQNHMIVATRLGVSNEKAMEHIGKAIEMDPGNLQLYKYLDAIALPAGKFEEAMTYYEYYVPRFYNENMIQDYAYLGQQANLELRAIDTLGRIDLSGRFAPGSAEYDAAKGKIDRLMTALQSSQ